MYSYLILGGASLAGRNLVRYLVENGLAKRIRVIDRVLLETGYFSPSCLKAFNQVEYTQSNLNNKDAIKRAFQLEDGSTWDIVINATLDVKRSQPKEIYEERIYNLSLDIANESIENKVKVLLMISSSQVYNTKKTPNKEDDELKGLSLYAQYIIKAEKEILNMKNLNCIILRPGLQYGPGDTLYIMPLLVLGKVYQHLKEPMPSFWKKDFKLNVIHVLDLARAIHHTVKWYIDEDKKGVEIFNVVDEGDTDSAKIQSIIMEIFGIRFESLNSVIINFFKSNLDQFLEDANDKHIEPWAELLKQHNIPNSPLIPYLDQEAVNLAPVWLDNTKIKKLTKFEVSIPKINADLLMEVLVEFQQMKLWPGKIKQ
ncbi:NAD(P)-binding protein [Neoconidiobolus thromboides FSU 785]|nr:NAD(P)-binding protein [Neoconidiobolus thromboides FSU 785]